MDRGEIKKELSTVAKPLTDDNFNELLKTGKKIIDKASDKRLKKILSEDKELLERLGK